MKFSLLISTTLLQGALVDGLYFATGKNQLHRLKSIQAAVDESRRSMLLASVGAAMIMPTLEANAEDRPRSVRSTAYLITATDPPMMQPYSDGTQKRILADLSKCPAVVLGGHPTERDHQLEALIVEKLAVDVDAQKRGIVVTTSAAVGNERTQKAIDAFVSKASSDEGEALNALRESSDWSRGESADSVLPVLAVARRFGARVVAVGLEPRVIETIREKGLASIGSETQEYVKSPKEFVQFVGIPGFKQYSNGVVSDLFELYSAAGGKGTLVDFFAAHILEDEVLAQRSYDAARARPGALLVVCAGIDHVKFGFGCHARLERIAQVDAGSKDENAKVCASIQVCRSTATPLLLTPFAQIRSIVLNPTASDSISLSKNLRLTLGYGDFLPISRPLANYAWFSSSPFPNLLTHMLNIK